MDAFIGKEGAKEGYNGVGGEGDDGGEGTKEADDMGQTRSPAMHKFLR